MSYLYYSLWIHEVPFFGKQPPSSKRRLISAARNELVWMPGTDDLAEAVSYKVAAFKDVAVPRSHLRKAIKKIREVDG